MPEISLSNVTKSFESQRGVQTTALNHVDLRVEDGTVVCLVGPSGCGKTTLLNLIAGFERPSGGDLRVGGRSVEGPGSDRVVIFQDVKGSLMPWWTAGQNVEFGLKLLNRGTKRERRAEAHKFLGMVGLDEAVDKYPDELSGGMQQRVQIARALITDPAVLLMDEPFGAIDFLTRSRLQYLLQELHLKRPTTTIFVTHDLTEAAILGDIICVMDARGRIAEMLSVAAERPRNLTTPAVVSAIEKMMEIVLPDEMIGRKSHQEANANQASGRLT